jgi:tetratricopeptide (TPR) repeat protein
MVTGSPRIGNLWLKRTALALLAPVVFFGLLEVALRTVEYGDPVTFFQTIDVGGQKLTVENPYFGQRFFRRHLPRTPAWNLIPERRAGVPRLAVIGESAAQGYPLQKIGLASMLGALLEAEYPGREFDFINASMTSVNSHVLTEVVPEVVALGPDITVFYMGNNEVVGPYGPGTPFTAWTRGSFFVWLDKKLRATKTYQLLDHLIARFVSPPPKSWEGFQMFSDLRVPADSPALDGVYEAFRRNLEDMVGRLLDGGSKVVLCTIAVNLVDWGPSGRAVLPPDSEAGKLLAQGRVLLDDGEHEQASAILGQARAVDPANAAIAFYLGRALQNVGRMTEAREAFSRARDLDEHRFRADSRINGIIRDVAQGFEGRGVVLVDAERDLAEDGLTSKKEFTEHVHLTFNGMSRLATLVARAIPALLPSLGSPRPAGEDVGTELRRRVFYTPFDEVLLAVVATEVGDMPIFGDRPAVSELRSYLQWIESQARAANRLDMAQLRSEYEASVLAGGPAAAKDASFADYLSRLGEMSMAAEAGQRVLERKPTYFEGFRFQADEAKDRGDDARAESLYRQALGIYRLIPDAWKNLGDLARRRGDQSAALSSYAMAVRLDARNVPAALDLAETEANTGDLRAARRTLEAARVQNAEAAEVEIALARLSRKEGDNAAARAHYERALGLDAQLSPREMLRFVAESKDSAKQHEIFGALEPRFGEEHDLYNNFAWLLATSPDESLRDSIRALRLARRAIELSPAPNAYYLGTLAAAQAANGDFGAALESLRAARELSPHNDSLQESCSRMEAAFRAGRPFAD